jgi:hypothetical protein
MNLEFSGCLREGERRNEKGEDWEYKLNKVELLMYD